MIEGDASVAGSRVHYRSAGTGPPVLLLHAVGESSYSWTRVLPALATGHTVVAPDLPGFGDSDRADGPCTPEFYAEVMADCLTQWDGRPATVVGNSFGGAVALQHRRQRSRTLPRAGHAVIEGAGHLAPLETPDAFRELLLAFLR